MRKLYVYIACASMFSCKKEIKINIEDRQPQLVVNAELNPDSFISFNLSLTQNITDNKPLPFVSDATIDVFDKDTVLKASLSHSSNGNYRSASFKPVPGENYFFSIIALGNVYRFEEKMPDTCLSSIVDTMRIIFQGKQNFFQCTFKLMDAPEKNYYGFRMKRVLETYQGIDTLTSEEWIPIESIDFVLTENPKTKFSKKNLLFTDDYFSGQKEFKFGGGGLFSTPGQKTKLLIIFTTSYSQSGYNYYTSVNEHLFYQNDPFSQPTLLIGNIPGAFGAAVGKYNRTDTIRFK